MARSYRLQTQGRTPSATNRMVGARIAATNHLQLIEGKKVWLLGQDSNLEPFG
jgi:hypothetical protein